MSSVYDALFNSSGRVFEVKFDIFFDGTVPTTVTSSSGVIDFDIQEASWEGEFLLGSPSPSTLDLTLDNTEGIFSPSNKKGPHYGKFNRGLKLVGELRVSVGKSTSPWFPLGTFYVSDWKAPSGEGVAQIFGYDKLQQVLSCTPRNVEICEGFTYKKFMQYYLQKLGYTAEYGASFGSILPYGWSEGTPSEDLSNLLNAMLACVTCARRDVLFIQNVSAIKNVRDTITDTSGNLLSVDDQNTLVRQYEDVQITYVTPTLEKNAELLSMEDISLLAGDQNLDSLSFDNIPAYVVESVSCQTEGQKVQVQKYSYSTSHIDLTLNAVTSGKTALLVKGTYVKLESTLIGASKNDNVLKLDNVFVQDSNYAKSLLNFLRKYISTDTPLIEVETIGNVQYQLLDRIKVSSERFHVDFDGLLINIDTSFDGGLTQKLTLINYTLVRGITNIHFDSSSGDLLMTFDYI